MVSIAPIADPMQRQQHPQVPPLRQLQLASAPRLVGSDGAAVALAARDAALLAWLALEGPTSRARIATLLWPDSDVDAARNALRQRLFNLRRTLGFEAVVGSVTLALAPGLKHDLEDADSVLGDAAPVAAGEFAAWLEQQRARRRGRTQQSLAELAQMAEAACDWSDALSHAQELLALAPLSEEAHRRLIRLHYLAGDRAAALIAFDRCERVLKDEVGAAPSAETLALLASIEAQRNEPALRPRVLPVGLLRPPRVVGRERESDELASAWSAGLPFLALGDAGIGKTRLLEVLARQWPGARLVPSRPGDVGVPLVLIGRLVDVLCEHHPEWAAAACVLALRDLLGSAPAPGPLGAIRPMPRPCGLPLRELLGLGLDAAPPIALLFDDLQFTDDASLAVLDEVLGTPALASLRWGWASRTHGALAQPRIDALRRRGGLRCITLRPLALEAITELIDVLHLGGTHAPELASALQRQVGGNPMFLLEALRRLLDQGRPLQAALISAPQRVHDLVEARLADLPPGQRLLMRVAAIAGADFDVELAEAVSGRAVLELADDWRTLERLALFDAHGIAHDVYAEATLADLPPAIARTLHARVAAHLEAQHRDPAQLAAHWLAAADDRRAQPHLLAAARKAWRAACAEETLHFYRQAAEIALRHGEPDMAFDHWFEAADALSEIGSPAQLQPCAEALQRLAHTAQQQVRIRLVLAALQHLGGQTETGLRALRDLLSDAIAVADLRVEAECRFAIAHRASADGAFDEALQQLAAGERLMRETGDTRRAAALSSSMALVLALRGQPRLAIAEQQRLMPLLESEGDRATLAAVCASKGLQHIYCADVAGALHETQRALDLAQRDSIAPPDLRIILRQITETLCWAGRYELALSAAHALAARLAMQGNFPTCADALGLLYLQLGRPDLAQPHLTAYLAQPRERRREQLHRAWVQAFRDCWSPAPTGTADWPADALRSEDLALACKWGLLSGLAEVSPWTAGELTALAARCGAQGVLLFGLPLRALQARRMIEAGDAGGGTALARQLEAELTGCDLVAGTPWAALFLAQALQRAGDAEAAARIARHGAAWVEQAARHAMPPEFRDSFRQRHPVHRALQALAQHGMSARREALPPG